MITGFNTDVDHNDRVYHVQTEDKGILNPYIESMVYVGGEILLSKKTSYAEQAEEGIDEKWISGLMEQQHRTMIAAVKRGRLDRPAPVDDESTLAAGTRAPSPAPVEQDEAFDDQEKTLDQVIIDYLASEAEKEHLELALLNHGEFVAGQSAELRMLARKSLSQQPIIGAIVELKLISTVEPPRILFKGATGPDGTTTIRCTIPDLHEGTAAVILSAHSDLGNDEVKQLVRRRK